MFRSFWRCKLGDTLKRSTAINGQSCSSSSSSAAAATRYYLLTLQNSNVLRVNSMFFCSSSTGNNVSSSSSISDSEFIVSYLIDSCGLSENEAITASRKVDFKTKSQPDSVLSLFENYGFTKPYISKLITKRPLFLVSDPLKTLKPKLDFYTSKGLHGIELAEFISRSPQVLTHSLKLGIIPSFDILKTFVSTDMNVIRIIKRSAWILNANVLQSLMVNLEILRYEGVPESTIFKYLITYPRSLIGDADKFKKVVGKVKGMGFDPLTTTFFVAIQALSQMSEATWKTKVDIYKRWGWSEDQIQTAFRKNPWCMMSSEKKITAIMDFLVNKMGYDSLSVAESPVIFTTSLEARIIPRCSVIRVLLSKDLIKEKISLSTISTIVDKYFLDRFVKPYEQEAPELMTVFQGRIR